MSETGKHVCILGLGPSVRQYLEITKRNGGRRAFADETWGINALGSVFQCDLVFHQDDVRVQEIRAAARPQSNIAHMVKWLRTYKGRVITSRKHRDYPCLEEFPLEQVLNDVPEAYFNNTAAYAAAYAVCVARATRISFFGCDYTYADAADAEKGRACLEFWIGIAIARGIQISVPKTTSLLDAMEPNEHRFYGYDAVHLKFNRGDDGITVEFEPRDRLPTADEIEARYDHSRHPNSIVEKGGV
jgi:hypothetical protein